MTDRLVEAFQLRMRALASAGRLGQFVSAGAAGFAVDNAVIFLLVEFGDLLVLNAKVLAWEAAVVVIFLINERWTFAEWGERGIRAVLSRFVRSNLIRVGGLAVTLVVLYVLTEWFDVWYIAANVVGIGLGLVVNYTFESLLTWRVHLDG